MTPAAALPHVTRVAGALSAHWRLKVRLSIALTLFFCIPYFLIQRLPLQPPRALPLSAIDRAIAFDPRWVWAYQSVYVLLSIVPWLADSKAELLRYARGFVRLSCVGFVFFVLLPIEGPRPPDATGNGMFRLLAWYDRPTNVFPSLHVGLAVFTVLFAGRISRGRIVPAHRLALLTLASIWVGLIAYSALATKQHFAVDLPAGALLAWLCDRRWRA
jgi:membrane-associated phospholipid phosphatase